MKHSIRFFVKMSQGLKVLDVSPRIQKTDISLNHFFSFVHFVKKYFLIKYLLKKCHYSNFIFNKYRKKTKYAITTNVM